MSRVSLGKIKDVEYFIVEEDFKCRAYSVNSAQSENEEAVLIHSTTNDTLRQDTILTKNSDTSNYIMYLPGDLKLTDYAVGFNSDRLTFSSPVILTSNKKLPERLTMKAISFVGGSVDAVKEISRVRYSEPEEITVKGSKDGETIEKKQSTFHRVGFLDDSSDYEYDVELLGKEQN